MIDYDKACQIAYAYFKEISIDYILTSALESEKYWIFSGGLKDMIAYGDIGIKISKDSGQIEPFILPNEINLLQCSKEIFIPEIYKF